MQALPKKCYHDIKIPVWTEQITDLNSSREDDHCPGLKELLSLKASFFITPKSMYLYFVTCINWAVGLVVLVNCHHYKTRWEVRLFQQAKKSRYLVINFISLCNRLFSILHMYLYFILSGKFIWKCIYTFVTFVFKVIRTKL